MKVECAPKEISIFPKNWNNKDFEELTGAVILASTHPPQPCLEIGVPDSIYLALKWT